MEEWRKKMQSIGNVIIWLLIFYMIGILAIIGGMIRGGRW